MFAHVRWANFSAGDLAGLARFRMVTLQMGDPVPLQCEAQARQVKADLQQHTPGGADVPVLFYNNVYFAEPEWCVRA